MEKLVIPQSIVDATTRYHWVKSKRSTQYGHVASDNWLMAEMAYDAHRDRLHVFYPGMMETFSQDDLAVIGPAVMPPEEVKKKNSKKSMFSNHK